MEIAMPASQLAGLGARPQPRRIMPIAQVDRGYLLTESLVALALTGIALMPMATLAPLAVDALRHYEMLGAATRAAAELAEANGPDEVLAGRQSAAERKTQLMHCDHFDGRVCHPGRRLAVALLPAIRPGASDGEAAVALWSRP